MALSRRSVLGAAPLLSSPVRMPAAQPAPAGKIRLAVSTYSYWHFRGPRFPIEDVIDHAAVLGFEGVEILHRQMRDESPSYVNGLKRRAFLRA